MSIESGEKYHHSRILNADQMHMGNQKQISVKKYIHKYWLGTNDKKKDQRSNERIGYIRYYPHVNLARKLKNI